NARPGIKFALGENVKQSRNPQASRYPQTRMGVETFIVSKLTEAREYAQAEKDYERFLHLYRIRRARTPDEQAFVDAYERGPIFRRDLELEALAEILDKERWIHCHSYRQDEILMLCRVAQTFGFRIGTFQHVLEGYKVADAIREVAVGASCFSDWWAYKVEVQDAIPENGAIMHEQGVNVSFNSDDANLARRMNLEAAKAVRYGGVSEEDALKFVTLNPAIQLGIDEHVGSLDVGKHADLVLWSGHPLSNYSVCQRTWVDGRTMFSLEQDAALRARIASERARLIQKLLDAPTDDDDPGEAPGEEIHEHEGRGICGCLEGA
ncbi:MAG: amidohydrolase family protein, partial [Phycisphaerales bacterium]|nr:amidohydrolase family protein [Phycisphaerales bacterium]